jgi:hypothetical protein
VTVEPEVVQSSFEKELPIFKTTLARMRSA